MKLIRVTSLTAAVGFLFVAQLSAQTAQQKHESNIEDAKEKLEIANQPINFYGQVLDQTGAPVKKFKIDATIFSWFDPHGKGDDYDQREDDYTLLTDTQGRFELHQKKGTNLNLELRPMEGYLYNWKRRHQFSFDPTMDNPGGVPIHRPDPKQPVVFRVWKAQGGETVVRWGGGYNLKQDGTLIGVDILGGNFLSADNREADFRVAVNAKLHTGLKHNRNDRYRWTVHLEGVNAKLVVADDEHMYLAPDTGYVSAVDITFDPSDPNWDFQKEIKFYLRAADGKHASRVVVHLNTTSSDQTGWLTVRAVTNLTGSRNLEEGSRVLSHLPRSHVDSVR